MKFTIAIVGTGNLAWHLAPALENAGHTITEVSIRELSRAKVITRGFNATEAKADLDFPESQAKIYLIAVSDRPSWKLLIPLYFLKEAYFYIPPAACHCRFWIIVLPLTPGYFTHFKVSAAPGK